MGGIKAYCNYATWYRIINLRLPIEFDTGELRVDVQIQPYVSLAILEGFAGFLKRWMPTKSVVGVSHCFTRFLNTTIQGPCPK